ncbi:MAG: hypothetical protein H7Z13_11375 [Ferruginibacter sp.]|nr:hypothetical protein [Ferruginibacter sp.]
MYPIKISKAGIVDQLQTRTEDAEFCSNSFTQFHDKFIDSTVKVMVTNGFIPAE